MNDNVMLLLFGDYLGLPNPISAEQCADMKSTTAGARAMPGRS